MARPEPDPLHRGPRRRTRGWLFFVAALVVLAVLLLVLDRYNPSLLGSEHGVQRLIYLLLLLVLIGPAVFAGRLSRNLRNLAVWGAVLAAVAIGYAFWHQGSVGTGAITAELMPRSDSSARAGEARFVADRSGDFLVRGDVNGVPVLFVVDTGESDVVLSRADARRIGLDPDGLDYNRRYQTANGPVFGASVRLGRVALGGVAIDDVRASVTDGGLQTSLLGMSFLNRLGGFSVRDGVLTLYQ